MEINKNRFVGTRAGSPDRSNLIAVTYRLHISNVMGGAGYWQIGVPAPAIFIAITQQGLQQRQVGLQFIVGDLNTITVPFLVLVSDVFIKKVLTQRLFNYFTVSGQVNGLFE